MRWPDARRRGTPISSETCPHYLTFAADDVADGATEFKCAPPIRDEENRQRLWRGLTDGVIDELSRFFADVTPFKFSLTGLHEFPGGTIYLAPSPAAPFRHLTHELARLFPEHPPYGGEFDDVVPHLTVPMPEGEKVAGLEFELGSRFPITTYAREAVLFWWEPGASRTVATFPFGTSAA